MNTTQLPEVVYDLRQFAAALPDMHRDLRKRLKRWLDAHSIASDLRVAAECVNLALRQNSTGRASLDLSKMALIQSAVMGYARALERHSDHRGRVAIMDKLTVEQQAFHKHLVHLRDEALAHYGFAGTSDAWNEDHALLVRNGDTWQAAIAARRSLFDKRFAKDLRNHLKALLGIVEGVVADRGSAFHTLMSEKLALDEVANALIGSALSDEAAVRFKSPILAGPREGRRLWIG